MNKSIGNIIFSVALVTLFSRVLSLVANQVYIAQYGILELNSYTTAVRMSNVIFTSVGTLLTTVVIPFYSGMIAKNDKTEAKKFLDDIVTISSGLTLILALVCYVLAPAFFTYSNVAHEDIRQGIYYMRVMLPVMFFFELNFIFQGILQSHGKFKLPAAVTLPSSIIIIGYVLFLGNDFGVTGLLYATMLGLAGQALLLLPAVLKTGYKYSFSFDLKSPHIIACRNMAVPVLIATSAYQINSAFNLYMSYGLGLSTLLALVQEIVIVSVLTFVYSVTAVYYPRLSVEWSSNSFEGYVDVLTRVIKMVIFMLTPATFGFILVRYNLFDLLSRWGKVTEQDILTAGNMLGLYSLGILAMGFKEVLDRAFYAQKNTKISAVGGFVIMGVNISLSLFMIGSLGIMALPLAYSISSTLGVVYLITVMGKKIGGFPKEIFITAAKCLAASLVMALVVWLEISFLNGLSQLGTGIAARIIRLFLPAATGIVVYFLLAVKFKLLDIVLSQ